MSEIVCTLVTSVIISQRSAWTWQAQEPDAPAWRPIRNAPFRLLLFLFPWAAKCDVIQVGNKDPNCREVGCRLLLSTPREDEGQGLTWGFNTLPPTSWFWATILGIYRASCLIEKTDRSLPDRRPDSVHLYTHCHTSLRIPVTPLLNRRVESMASSLLERTFLGPRSPRRTESRAQVPTGKVGLIHFLVLLMFDFFQSQHAHVRAVLSTGKRYCVHQAHT